MNILNKLVTVCGNLSKSGDLELYGSKAVTYQKERMQLILLRHSVLSTSREIADQFGKLADIYAVMHQYDNTLSNYEKAVNLYLSNDKSEAEQWTLSYNLIKLCEKIVKICTEHTQDSSLALKYQLLQHECKLKQVEDVFDGVAVPPDGKARYLAESHFSMADCYTHTGQYVAACEHLTEGLKYIRLSKDLLLQNGLTLAWCDDHHLLVPLAADDNQLIDCELKIKEKEDKLRLIQSFVEKS
jgi:tetratricopeptide (TPR) repeat protein